ncbi:hypothetical protein E2C01_001951 [Portunus trituberculatus]|uniref:Uncharacterized protein n=1 Tax=Portunus trituberculatus TaxID=210409 RepID=A0A5B7CP08_PORTR|nr:hypothetical protein [Portunus trituberculatus]
MAAFNTRKKNHRKRMRKIGSVHDTVDPSIKALFLSLNGNRSFRPHASSPHFAYKTSFRSQYGVISFTVWGHFAYSMESFRPQSCLSFWLTLRSRDMFHWTQTKWRKVQEVGLQHGYTHDDETCTHLRRVMALPFLPEEEIISIFERLTRQATTAQSINQSIISCGTLGDA